MSILSLRIGITVQIAIPSRPSTSNADWAADRRRAELQDSIGPLQPGFPCFLTDTCLGRGGQTAAGVYVGINGVTKEFVAVKRLPADSQQVVDSTLAEYHLIKSIPHTNLVRYFGLQLNVFAALPGLHIGQRDELWLIMELCQRDNLKDLAKRKLAFEEIVDIAQQVLRGLHHLHVNGIVHRDLKCQNVLVGMDGTIKLADFGLIKQLEGTMTRTNELQPDTGTLRYMAPEVVLEDANREYKIGRLSDIWSFGCMLPEMLTGNDPEYVIEFTNIAKAVLHIIQGNGPLFPSGLSDRFSPEQIRVLQQVFRRCIVKEPDNRPHAIDLLNFFESISSRAKPTADVDELAQAVRSWNINGNTRHWASQSASFDGGGGGGILGSVRKLLRNAGRMKIIPVTEREVAKFRYLPFKYPRYIMVLTNDPKTFIRQFINEHYDLDEANNRIPFGILLESDDRDLVPPESRMNARTGTLESTQDLSFHTLIVWPNGAACRRDMWTTKDQLERVFSVSAVQVIVVGPVLTKEFQKARTHWKGLVRDAENVGRLIGSPPSVACRSA
ncbi:serine/threonine-protein kinase 25-like isoform X2 [Paramacrobiotus metropolitanus]|uniref:serine/threonine-protein kinase 25-like isoform X2 n=1 Tax=Paramacrobiotus metropolitanus TaxID=2943436 RepID=UPI002445FD4F|nr:serine/threonine-protein kinase 25-like isoform X2 [Paramacrobiotus metropolitanus]